MRHSSSTVAGGGWGGEEQQEGAAFLFSLPVAGLVLGHVYLPCLCPQCMLAQVVLQAPSLALVKGAASR